MEKSQFHAAEKGYEFAAVLEAAQGGDQSAIAHLWITHWTAARKFAMAMSSNADPDDLVSAAFEKILVAWRNGKGPTTNFRPYLYTTIRNLAVSRARASRELPLDAADNVRDPRLIEAFALREAEGELLWKAFDMLSPTWQEVLWMTVAEGKPAREIGPALGLSANAAAALSHRAREGFKQSWIQVHVEADTATGIHLWVLQRAGRGSQAALSRRDQAKFDSHLHACRPCTVAIHQAIEASRSVEWF